MRANLNTASLNVAHHAANANCAVLCGHSADRVVTALKRQLGRKRQSVSASYEPETLRPGSMRMPGQSGQRRLATSDQRPVVQTFPDSGVRPATAEATPAPVWAALVISRALSS
jgi:hypothetical protein